MKGRLLLLLAFFSVLFQILKTASVAPTWVINPLIQSGTKVIVQNSAFQVAGGLGPYTVTYSPAFSSSPWTALGLVSIETTTAQPTSIKYKINIDDYTNTTVLKIKMVYHDQMSLKTFKVSYLAVDPSLSYLKVDYFERSSLINVSSGTGARVYKGLHDMAFTVDSTHTISVIPLLIGVAASATNGIYSMNWTTTLQDNDSVYYQLDVNLNTIVTEIISYILVVDRTVAQTTQQIFLDEVYFTVVNNQANSVSLLFSSPNNFHAGLNSFNLTQFMFDLDKTTLGLNAPGGQYLNISGWNFRKRQCAAGKPNYQLNTNLCYDTCPTGYTGVNGNQMKYCRPCSQLLHKCTACPNSTHCTTCQDPWYVGNNNLCACPNGKFIDGSNQCINCHSNCTTCTTTATTCTSCDNVVRQLVGINCSCIHGLNANGNCNNVCTYACTSCQSNASICQVCKSSFQLVAGRCKCADRNYLDSLDQICKPCHPLCNLCTGPGSNQCASCFTNNNRVLNSTSKTCVCAPVFQQNPQGQCVKSITAGCTEGYVKQDICVEICGDGRHLQLECDDGNLIDGDGCSHECKIEPLFKCISGNLTTRSYCSFDGFLNFSVIQAQKDVYSNKIFLQYRVTPYLFFLAQFQDFIPYCQYNFDFVSVNRAVFDNTTRIFSVDITYTQHLHMRELQLIFIPPESATTFAIRQSSNAWTVAPSNNLAALSYDEAIYYNAQIADYAATGSYIAALVISAISLFFRKTIGMELISLFQISFLSIIMLEYAQPLLGVITNWKYIFGYNEWYLGQPESLPQYSRFELLRYKTLFGYSVNVMLMVNAAIYIGSGVCFLVSLCTNKSTARKFKEVASFFPREVAFGMLFFQLLNISVATGIEAYYGNILNLIEIWSKIYEVVALALILVHYIAFLATYPKNVDSYSFYKRDSKFSKLHPILLFWRNILLGGWLVLTMLVPEASYVILSIQGGYILLIICLRPYKRVLDTVRALIIEVGIEFTLASRFIEATFVNIQITSDTWGKFYNYSAYIQYGFLIVSLLLSAISIIYHLCRIKKDGKVNPHQNEEDQGMSEISQIVIQKKDNYASKEMKKEHINDYDFEDGDLTGPSDPYSFYQSKRRLKGQVDSDRRQFK